MSDDFAVVREALSRNGWRIQDGQRDYEPRREGLAALDRIEARLAETKARADHYYKAFGAAADQRDKARADAERLAEALRPIIHEFDLWSEDANDGEFRLWDLDRLVMAIVSARKSLAAHEEER